MHKNINIIVKESGKSKLPAFVPPWSRCRTPLVCAGATSMALALWLGLVSSAPCRKLPCTKREEGSMWKWSVKPGEQPASRKGESRVLYAPQSAADDPLSAKRNP